MAPTQRPVKPVDPSVSNYLLTQSWPARAVQGLLAAARLPGDAAMGKYRNQPRSAMIEDATDFALNVGLLGSAVPRPVNSVGMGGLVVDDVFKFDNPGTSRGNWDWVRTKQKYAEEDMRNYSPKTASGKGLSGSATAYTKAPINLDTEFLSKIKGAMDEVRKPGDAQYDELIKTVEKEGWNPDPIMIVVNHKGQPFISEGNTRVAVAKAKGINSVPAEVRWLNGGELATGMTPEQLLQYFRSGGS